MSEPRFLDNLKQILVDAGLDANVIFKSSKATIPTGDGPYLTIAETGGSGPEGTHNAAAAGYDAYERPNAQILVRAKSYVDAREMSESAKTAFVKFGKKSQFVQGVWYRSIILLQQPFDTGVDSVNRATVTFNIATVKRPDVVTSS